MTDSPPDPYPSQRSAITRASVGIGAYAAALGATFGAVSVGVGLSLAQTLVLSAVMFTGASQFAFVGVIGSGGAVWAAIPAALLLGLRNSFYGVAVTQILRPRGLRRFAAAQLVIDETTAMAVAQGEPRLKRYAFWATAGWLYTFWVLGTLGGALAGRAIDPMVLGLDAAAPATFLALLWPQLKQAGAPLVAVLGAVVAVVLIPVAPAGVPVIAAAFVAVVVGLTPPRQSAATVTS
jgi:4-azaleucine resistance transporter AzlC